jgi:uncharacterized membrane protein YhaH (DUF805 family)
MRIYLISKYWLIIPFLSLITSLFYLIKFSLFSKKYNGDKCFKALLFTIISLGCFIIVALVCSLYKYV